MINIKNSVLIILFSFYLFPNQDVFEWDSMTSLIDPTSLTKDSNDNLIAATSGGLLVLDETKLNILKDNFTTYIADFRDGQMAKRVMPGVNFIDVENVDKFPNNSVVVFQSFLPWNLNMVLP